MRIPKPILITGVGLSAVLWGWETFGHSLWEMGEVSFNGVIALGGLLWLLQRRQNRQNNPAVVAVSLGKAQVETTIATTAEELATLAATVPELDLTNLQQQVEQLPDNFQRQQLNLGIVGNPKVGKSSLKEVLQQQEGGEKWQYHEGLTNTPLDPSLDLLLYLVNGDITDSEWQEIQGWQQQKYHILLLLNKQDQYLLEERIILLEQIKNRVKAIIPPENILGITAKPQPIKVRQHQPDGTIQEWQEFPTPDIASLQERLNQITSSSKTDLILASTWRQAIAIQQEIRQISNQLQRQKALPLIERYQWIAGATALANPVPAVDIVATVAINAQMLVDIAAIYQQKFSLDQAQTVASTLGELIVKLGLVEMTTQTLAGMLKSNSMTYLAGGSLQGVSAAYWTRIAGLTVVEYLETEKITGNSWNREKLQNILQRVFATNQNTRFWQNFWQQSRKMNSQLTTS